MKRLNILLLIVFLGIFEAKAFSHDIMVANAEGLTIHYEKMSKTELMVIGNYYAGDIVIPETVAFDGIIYTVTSIGDYAFWDCDNLRSVTIPNTVRSIGSSAFDGCSSLKNVEIPSTVISIGSGAFEYCSSLTSVTVGMEIPVRIDNMTFSNRFNATLYVPVSCKDKYETADYWNQFGKIVESESASILLQTTEEASGKSSYYNLKGQRVEIPSKGLFIKDNKKIFVK